MFPKFHFSDFIDVTNEDDQEIEFDWGRYQRNLGDYIKELAADRYRRVKLAREGLDNVLEDAAETMSGMDQQIELLHDNIADFPGEK